MKSLTKLHKRNRLNFEIISWKRQNIKKVIGYIAFFILVVGISSMLKSFGGGESWFKTYDLPTWVYVLNIVFMFVVAIVGVSSLSSNVPVIGSVSVDADKVLVSLKGQLFKVKNSELESFTVKENFQMSRTTGDMRTFNVHFASEVTQSLEFQVHATKENAAKLIEILTHFKSE